MSWLRREIDRFNTAIGALGLKPELIQRINTALTAVEQRWSKDTKARAHEAALERLPSVKPDCLDLDSDRVGIGTTEALTPNQAGNLLEAMEALIPWRKGPFNIFGEDLDTEWASNLKWNRLNGHIQPLNDRRILDIGSSSGYYLWRMVPQRPRLVLGIEPYLTYFAQYLFLQHFICQPEVFCLPLKLDQLPDLRASFDTLFCMGILYHTREPLSMLTRMRGLLASGGELVLETLVIEGPPDHALCPQGRYAKMGNVWFIPSVQILTYWLKLCGFGFIRCIDTTLTTAVEQRRTRWMPFESLDDFLDPDDPTRTIEGYPAPLRVILLATAS